MKTTGAVTDGGPATTVSITIPGWAKRLGEAFEPTTDPSAQVGFVLSLVAANIQDGGGPFAAAIFDEAGNLVASGVNRVVPDKAPIAHAEIVAIAAAGQSLGTWDLGSVGEFRLVTSTEPCAMCMGAVPWSGVRSVVISARDEDARAVGFDEGAKSPTWVADLEALGITVIRDVDRPGGAAALASYKKSGGVIYNGGANE